MSISYIKSFFILLIALLVTTACNNKKESSEATSNASTNSASSNTPKETDFSEVVDQVSKLPKMKISVIGTRENADLEKMYKDLNDSLLENKIIKNVECEAMGEGLGMFECRYQLDNNYDYRINFALHISEKVYKDDNIKIENFEIDTSDNRYESLRNLYNKNGALFFGAKSTTKYKIIPK